MPHIESVRVGVEFQKYTGNLLELESSGDVEVGAVPVVEGVDIGTGLKQGAAVFGVVQPHSIAQRCESLLCHGRNIRPFGEKQLEDIHVAGVRCVVQRRLGGVRRFVDVGTSIEQCLHGLYVVGLDGCDE